MADNNTADSINTTNETKTDLISLLNKYDRVSIPMIQRDYAQGRKEEEEKLQSFLDSIRKYLEGKNISLDFVYGYVENNNFHPLDGQQRITTIWLLNLYFEANNYYTQNNTPDIDTLKKFTYETRDSSMEFCKELCEHHGVLKHDPNDPTKKPSERIQEEMWFFTEWKQDPTVSAMLNAFDQIDEQFNKTRFDHKKLVNYLEDLKFELLCITDNNNFSEYSADDLYIKINARGKKLTGFENYKSAWEEDLKNKKITGYFKLIDKEWTNVIWELCSDKKDPGNKFDEIYFHFLTRFVTNERLLDNKTTSITNDNALLNFKGSADYKGKGVEKGRGVEIKEKVLTYQHYKEYITADLMEILKNIFNVFSGDVLKVDKMINGTIGDCLCRIKVKEQKGFEFFGKNPLSEKQRVYFHAVCLFLNRCKDSQDFLNKSKNFEDWIRVVRNITENSEISDVSGLIGCLSLIDNIGKDYDCANQSIYSILAKNGAKYEKYADKNTLRGAQYQEECEKAKQIATHPTFKADIQENEDYAFFSGKICFLYRDEQNIPHWENFSQKVQNARRFFSDPDNPNNKDGDPNTVSYETIQTLLKHFGSFKEIEYITPFISVGYTKDHGKTNFRDNILCGKLSDGEEKSVKALVKTGSIKKEDAEKELISKKMKAVHKMLMGEKPDIHGKEQIGKYSYDYSKFVNNTALIERLLNSSHAFSLCFAPSPYNKDFYRLYPPNKNFFYFPSRALYLHEEREKKVRIFKDMVTNGLINCIDKDGNNDPNYYLCGNYLCGVRILFKYQNHPFLLYINEEKHEERIVRLPQKVKKASDISENDLKKKFFVWENADDLKTELDKLLS